MRPAKTQISLGIRPVWSESSLCAQWVAKDQIFLHVDSEDSDQTGWMPIRPVWSESSLGAHAILLVLSWDGSYSTMELHCWMHASHARLPMRIGNTDNHAAELRRKLVHVIKTLICMSRDMTKPTKWMCAQRRLRSAWASAQSDKSLHCPHEETLGP